MYYNVIRTLFPEKICENTEKQKKTERDTLYPVSYSLSPPLPTERGEGTIPLRLALIRDTKELPFFLIT